MLVRASGKIIIRYLIRVSCISTIAFGPRIGYCYYKIIYSFKYTKCFVPSLIYELRRHVFVWRPSKKYTLMNSNNRVHAILVKHNLTKTNTNRKLQDLALNSTSIKSLPRRSQFNIHMK